MFLDKILQRDAHLVLDHARVINMSTDAEELRALIAFPTKAREPTCTSPTNRWRDGNSLHVCDRRWAAEKANVRGERWLETRFTLLAFQTFDERGLFSTDVRASPAMDVDIEGITRATGILSDKTSLVCLCDGLLKMRSLLEKLATDVNVRGGGVHRAPSNEAALYEFVGVTAQNFAVFTCSGLSLVSVDDEVAGSGIEGRITRKGMTLKGRTSDLSPSQAYS